MRTVIFWLRLPLRILGHLCRFVFGHPVHFLAVFTALFVLFSYMATIQITPDVQVAATSNTQRIVWMFPAAALWAAACGMVGGALLMWMSEHHNQPITTWTTAPSLWDVPVVDTSPVDEVVVQPRGSGS